MRGLKDWLVGTLGTAVLLSAAASLGLLVAGSALMWANKHALVPATYASAAIAAAPMATKLGRSASKSTLAQFQRQRTARNLLLVSPGQQDRPLRVGSVNPAHLRIHQAGGAGSLTALTPVPYVKRDLHDALAERIAAGSFVLLQGGSAVGKSRLAFEAARSVVPHWTMVVPDLPATMPGGLAELAKLVPTRTLIWLDDLQRYLTPDGLTERVLDRLVSPQRGVTVLATLNSGAKAALGRSDTGSTDRALRADALRIVERAEHAGLFYIDARLTPEELKRADAAVSSDKRIADATSHNADDGFGPRLAGGPAALARWRDSRNGGNRIGGAIIDAAVNLRLAGYSAPIPAPMLLALSREHLPTRYHQFDDQAFSDALTWSCDSERDTRPCLEQIEPDRFDVFDYLTDHAQRYPDITPAMPQVLWHTAIDASTVQQCYAIGVAALNRSLLDIAEQALEKAASAGDPQSLNGLAIVIGKNPARHDEAEKLYRRAIAGGDDIALYNLGNLLTENPARHDEAEQFYRRAIDAGDTDALFNLAVVLTKQPARRTEAEHYYRRAIDAGDTYALNNLANLLRYDPACRKEVEQLYRRAIDKGDHGALNNLANLLADDPARRKEVEQLYRRAIDAGSTKALANLALLLAEDFECHTEAEQLYHRAIDTGSIKALAGLADLLADDPTRCEEAEEFYLRAIDAGDIGAENNLANLLTRYPARREEAENLFRRAIETGDILAVSNLANLLAKDPEHHEEAEQLYHRAIDAGRTTALNNLATMLSLDAARHTEAEQLYYRSIDAGDVLALSNLANLLAGDPARRDEAERLYRRAIKAGNTFAENNLADLLSDDPARRAEAEQLYHRAIDAGDNRALYGLALLLARQRRRRKEARECYLRAVSAGVTGYPDEVAALLGE